MRAAPEASGSDAAANFESGFAVDDPPVANAMTSAAPIAKSAVAVTTARRKALLDMELPSVGVIPALSASREASSRWRTSELNERPAVDAESNRRIRKACGMRRR